MTPSRLPIVCLLIHYPTAVKQVIGGGPVGCYFLLTSRCTVKRLLAWMSLRVWGAVRLKLKGWFSSSRLKHMYTHISISTVSKQNFQMRATFDGHGQSAFFLLSWVWTKRNTYVLLLFYETSNQRQEIQFWLTKALLTLFMHILMAEQEK